MYKKTNYNLSNMKREVKAATGAPLGIPGKGPEEAAMSIWQYFSGFADLRPCLSKPEAIIRNAAGP